MPPRPLTDEQLADTVIAFRRLNNISHVAQETGVPRQTVQSRLKTARSRGLLDVSFPALPSLDIPVDDDIDAGCEEFLRRQEYHRAAKWMRYSFDSDKPVALVFVGDPHIDDNSCNLPLLREDIATIEATKGMWGVGLGDWLNAWVGKLQRLWIDQETSGRKAWRRAEWLLKKQIWLLLLLGNHDSWMRHNGVSPFDFISRQPAPLMEWRAQIELAWPCGRTCRIDAAHDFKGHSMWNEMHAPAREAKMTGGAADIYVAGHRHTTGYAWTPIPQAERSALLLRASGYKWHDEWAWTHGYRHPHLGASLAVTIDPTDSGPDWLMPYRDLRRCAKDLTAMRKRKT